MVSRGSLFDGRELPVSGEQVSALVLDGSIVLLFGLTREHELRVGNESDVMLDGTDGAILVHYDPFAGETAVAQNVNQLCAVVLRTVTWAAAYVDGILELKFNNGVALRVEPHPRYEAWVYTYGNYILACPPGGDLRG
jgi:Family of unknown function (DUF6188)